MTQRHVISLSAQDPEERNRDAKIQILERGRPRVTQKPRAPSPDLLKQTRDQGCGSRGSLPLPSVPPTLQFPAPAQLRLLHIPEAEFSWPWEYVPWDWNPASSLKQLAVCVCVCVCACARAVLGWCLLCTQPSPSPPSPQTHTVVHIFNGPDHAHLYTHARVTHTHSKLETCSGSPSLKHMCTRRRPTTPTDKSHLPLLSQPAIHPSATPEGFPTPATHREGHKTKFVNPIRLYTQRQGIPSVLFTAVSQMPGTVPGIL